MDTRHLVPSVPLVAINDGILSPSDFSLRIKYNSELSFWRFDTRQADRRCNAIKVDGGERTLSKNCHKAF